MHYFNSLYLSPIFLPFNCSGPHALSASLFHSVTQTHMHTHTDTHTIQFLESTVGRNAHGLDHAEEAGINSNQAWTGRRAILFCTTPGVTQTRRTPHLRCVCMSTRIHTHIQWRTCAIVISLGRQTGFCLLHISCIVDINTMLMKPLTPSFTCLFQFAENFKQPRGAANAVAHNKKHVCQD